MLVLHKHVLTTQEQRHRNVFCVQSLLYVVFCISNPIPVNNTQDGYKLLLDVNSSDAIVSDCSPGSCQGPEMPRKRGKKEQRQNQNRTGVGEKADTSMLTHLKDPQTMFSLTAMLLTVSNPAEHS